MNHSNLKCHSNDSPCPCIKCIKNEEIKYEFLNEVQVFHLTVKLLNIQVFTTKKGIGTANESGTNYLKKIFL